MKTITAKAEDNGEVISIAEVQHWISAPTLEDPKGRIPGMISLRRVDTGGAVNLLKDGRLQEVASGRIFRRT